MTDKLYFPEEAMPLEERERYYNEKVRQVVQFAYENAPAMRDRLDKAGVKPSQIKTTKDLELIPSITRDNIIELQKANPPFGGLLAVPVPSLYRLIYSPGPIYVPLGSTEYANSARKILNEVGLRKGDLAILSMPNLFMAGASIEDAMVLDGIVGIPAGAGNTELQVNMIRDLGIKGYIGTPTFLMNLLRKAEELGYDFHQEFRLRCALVWGEPLLPEVRNTLEQDYGIRLTDGLGVGVGLDLGYDCSQRTGFHITEEQFVEIVEPDTGKQLPTGEVGALLVTGFSNNAFPMIRYMTGDLSSLATESCPCGRTSPRLTGILGRVGDSVKVRALYLTPGQVKTVVSRFPEISKYQVVVGRVGYKDEMTFNLELADESIDRDKFFKALQTSFQDACRLRIDKFNVVPPGTIPEDDKTIKDERSWQIKAA